MSEKTLFFPGESAASPAMRDLSSTAYGCMAGRDLPMTQDCPDPDSADGAIDIIYIKKVAGPGGSHMTVCPMLYTGSWNQARVSLTFDEYKGQRMQLSRLTNRIFEHEFPNLIEGTGKYEIKVWKLETTEGAEYLEVNSSEYTIDYLNGKITFAEDQDTDYDFFCEGYYLKYHCVERSTSKNTWDLLGRYEEVRDGMDGFLCFNVLNPVFDRWANDVPEGWTVVGSGTIESVDGIQGKALKFSSAGNGETYIKQQIDVDGYPQVTFLAVVKVNGSFKIGVDNGGGWAFRIFAATSTDKAWDKYVMIALTSQIDETPSPCQIGIWPQVNTTDIGSIQIEAVELVQGGL